MECVFCASEEIRERIVFENELARSFPTNIPIVPGHMLVIPKRHIERYEELTSAEKDSLEELRMKLHHSLQKIFGAAGFNYAWNEGAVAGQSVPHLHLHIVPRIEGDAGIHQYEPRVFLYRPGSRAQSPDEELAAVATQLREAI